MSEDDLPEINSMNIEETIDALDSGIEKMSERISNGEFDEEEEQVRISRLNALSNAVDAKRRLIESSPDTNLSELWAEDLE